MRTKFNNAELAHVWANERQDHGDGSSMYFRGKEIYSYGDHFCIAKIVPGAVLYTTRSYSNSTAKHKNHVWRAIASYRKRIDVPYPELNMFEKKGFYNGTGSNAETFAAQIVDLIDIIKSTRRRPHTKDKAASDLSSLMGEIDAFLEVTGESITKPPVNKEGRVMWKKFVPAYKLGKGLFEMDEYKAAIKRAMTSEERAAQKRKRLYLKELAAKVPQWQKGAHRYDALSALPEVYLRVMPESTIGSNEDHKQVETSHGARVSYKAARVLFLLIEAGKDVKGHEIDGYTVISMNGHLKVGCHEIERAEVFRFAKSQGWITKKAKSNGK